MRREERVDWWGKGDVLQLITSRDLCTYLQCIYLRWEVENWARGILRCKKKNKKFGMCFRSELGSYPKGPGKERTGYKFKENSRWGRAQEADCCQVMQAHLGKLLLALGSQKQIQGLRPYKVQITRPWCRSHFKKPVKSGLSNGVNIKVRVAKRYIKLPEQ